MTLRRESLKLSRRRSFGAPAMKRPGLIFGIAGRDALRTGSLTPPVLTSWI